MSVNFLVSIVDLESDFEEYQKLKVEDVSSIRKEDLPSEFGDGAFKTVDEFKNINDIQLSKGVWYYVY